VANDSIPGNRGVPRSFPMGEDEQRARLALLVLRRTALVPAEVYVLRKVFPQIVRAHRGQVWRQIEPRCASLEEANELAQEVFLGLFRYLVARGFPDSLPAMIGTITDGLLANHVRGDRRRPRSTVLPSSSSEPPRTPYDADRSLDLQALSRWLLPQLTPEHRDVFQRVVLDGDSYAEAAAALGLPLGTLKARLMAAKARLADLARPHLPESQRT
jgi:RNA polymerase sigma-70 factor (ECF subfamily)